MSKLTPEGAVKKDIKDWLASIGAYQFWPVQFGYGKRTVDCLACINGGFVAFEVKRPGIWMPTTKQGLVLKEVHDAKGLSFTTDSLERTKEYILQHALRHYNPETGE